MFAREFVLKYGPKTAERRNIKCLGVSREAELLVSIGLEQQIFTLLVAVQTSE